MVILAALRWGVWEATAATVASFLFLDYFFTAPLFSLRMENSENWIALGTFEVVGLIVGRLSARERQQARLATEERNNMTRLYELSRFALQLDRRNPPEQQIARFIQNAIGVETIALYDPATERTGEAGIDCPGLGDLAREAWTRDADSGVDSGPLGTAQIWLRVLRVGGKSIGAIAMRGKNLNPLVADATASIAAIALERSGSLEREARTEAARQSDQLRTAVLDALAHAFKTPLTAIRVASSGLLETGALRPAETELVALIDHESEHLSELATQLLQTARLDQADMPVSGEECQVSGLIDDVLQRLPAGFESHRLDLEIPAEDLCISGNRELIVVALLQLVDNALKYSAPGSPIGIGARCEGQEVVISVHNEGPTIRPEDRQSIFERFYRAPGAEALAPGTGLGLSITRKIAEAHGGRTWVVSEEKSGTTFYFAVPATLLVSQGLS
jgi:two-component system sensor histidine kinase KdpD